MKLPHNLYTSPNTIRVMKSRMRWVGHVARMEEMRNSYNILIGKSERKNHLEDLGIDGGIILEWILEKQSEKVSNHVYTK
jgi:hypothetical protein